MSTSSMPPKKPNLDGPAYESLRRLAHRLLKNEKLISIDATGLLHEAILKFLSAEIEVNDERHLKHVVARIMRNLIIDIARARRAQKRGPTRLDTLSLDRHGGSENPDFLELDTCLAELERLSSRMAQIVELRYFGGFTIREIAKAMDMGESTVSLELKKAKAWMRRRLRREMS